MNTSTLESVAAFRKRYVNADYSFEFKPDTTGAPLHSQLDATHSQYLELVERLREAGILDAGSLTGINGKVVLGQLGENEQAIYLHVPKYLQAFYDTSLLHANQYGRNEIEQKNKATNQLGGLFFLSFNLTTGLVVGLPMRDISRLSTRVNHVEGQIFSYTYADGSVTKFANNIGYTVDVAVGILIELFDNLKRVLTVFGVENPTNDQALNLEAARLHISKDRSYLLRSFNLLNALSKTGDDATSPVVEDATVRISDMITRMDDIYTFVVVMSDRFNYSSDTIKNISRSYNYYGRMVRPVSTGRPKESLIKSGIIFNYTVDEVVGMQGLPISFLSEVLSDLVLADS